MASAQGRIAVLCSGLCSFRLKQPGQEEKRKQTKKPPSFVRCGERQVIPAAVDWAAAAFTQDKVSPNFTAESNESVFF